MSTGKELTPLPIQSPMIDNNGMVSMPWAGFFRQVLYRIGGFVAPTNLQLSTGSITPTVYGSRGSPQLLTAASALPPTAAIFEQTWFVAGNGAPITVVANPQISVGTVVGQKLRLIGCSDANWLLYSNGTGLVMDGSCKLGNDSVLELIWDGANWTETGRKNELP